MTKDDADERKLINVYLFYTVYIFFLHVLSEIHIKKCIIGFMDSIMTYTGKFCYLQLSKYPGYQKEEHTKIVSPAVWVLSPARAPRGLHRALFMNYEFGLPWKDLD